MMEHEWDKYFDIKSEYWEKVHKIYKENDSFPKVVVRNRNLHHKFPKSFSKKDGTEIDNDKDNLVSLSLSDHFLVHYYLWKCSLKGYRGMMARAFQFMRKKAIKYATDETIEILAKDYAEALKDMVPWNKGKKMSEETKKKMTEANKGKWKGKTHSAESRKKMSDSWDYNKHFTTETKKKLSDARKGKTPMKGHHLSDDAKIKVSKATKGKHWYNNGIKCIRAIECPKGYKPGRLTN